MENLYFIKDRKKIYFVKYYIFILYYYFMWNMYGDCVVEIKKRNVNELKEYLENSNKRQLFSKY